jgi:hypothetical protein
MKMFDTGDSKEGASGMHFSNRSKTMFQTIFVGAPDDYSLLLDFLRWLHEGDVANLVLNDPMYSPSPLWQTWLSETFVGFSSNKMLLQGGHFFPGSTVIPHTEGVTQQGFLNIIRQAARTLNRESTFGLIDIRELHNAFKKCYPETAIPLEHRSWFSSHPSVYFRALEAFTLTSQQPPAKMLEVGAGACVNVAFHHSLYPGIKSVVIDLPESIFFGYAFLRSILPDAKICLPHQVNSKFPDQSFDVTFLLPNQAELVPDGEYDFGFNMASFQEMDISRVNNYIDLIYRKLRTGGRLVSLNQRVSRHIKGNSLDKYVLSQFGSAPVIKDALFGNWLNRSIKGISNVHCEVVKA